MVTKAKARKRIERTERPDRAERNYVFRALAFPREDYWVAACIDLDIFVQGETLPDVKAKLLDAVHLYLESAVEEGLEKQLIPRKAPVWYRILWWVSIIASGLRAVRDRLMAFRLIGDTHQLRLA